MRDFRKRYLAELKKEEAKKTPPMLRLLRDCFIPVSGTVEVDCHQQWRTIFKAERLGYIDKDHHITEKGYAFIDSFNKEI